MKKMIYGIRWRQTGTKVFKRDWDPYQEAGIYSNFSATVGKIVEESCNLNTELKVRLSKCTKISQ